MKKHLCPAYGSMTCDRVRLYYALNNLLDTIREAIMDIIIDPVGYWYAITFMHIDPNEPYEEQENESE